MVKGALHLHSTYSDGEFTLPELRELFLAAQCSFACMTDHADWFDAASLSAYVDECEALSDERFAFIAGLEFNCFDGMHVLGYGVVARAASCDPNVVIRHIERAGGLAVIAHPRETAFPTIEALDVLPGGIEVWNSKYDGPEAPRPGTFALLSRLRQRRLGMTAFFGQDLHGRKQYRELFTLVDCQAPAKGTVLRALQCGGYVGLKGDLVLPSSGALPRRLERSFGRVHQRSQLVKRCIEQVKTLAGRPVPS
jgi:hypothetical protein